MYSKSRFVFWTTLVLYIVTLFTVSYVGVHLTYIAIPVIVISGLIMTVSKPKISSQQASEVGKVTSSFLSELSGGLDSMNNSLEKYNEKMKLINDSTKLLREKRNKFKLEKIAPEIELKYAKDQHDIDENNKIIKDIDMKINEVDIEIDEIKKQCELEIEEKYLANS